MEGHTSQHLKTSCTPYPATALDIYHLEQEPGETLRHYVWRFRGVVDHIPPTDLQEISGNAVFHVNVRSVKMRENLSVHVLNTLEELWRMADRCARAEEASILPPREAP